jgi:plastocyanin
MRTLLTCLLAVFLPLCVAACGGDDKKDGGGAGATFAKTDTVVVTGSEFKFNPGNVTVTGGGGPIKFDFKNDGSTAHNLKIEKDGEDVGGSDTFQGGKSEDFTADLAPGDYTLICTVGDHAGLGMKGKLTVK